MPASEENSDREHNKASQPREDLQAPADHRSDPHKHAQDPRLLADRLCYLAEGMDGLRRRDGLINRYGKTYQDDYDRRAASVSSIARNSIRAYNAHMTSNRKTSNACKARLDELQSKND